MSKSKGFASSSILRYIHAPLCCVCVLAAVGLVSLPLHWHWHLHFGTASLFVFSGITEKSFDIQMQIKDEKKKQDDHTKQYFIGRSWPNVPQPANKGNLDMRMTRKEKKSVKKNKQKSKASSSILAFSYRGPHTPPSTPERHRKSEPLNAFPSARPSLRPTT